jgi:hypothetical protein
VLKHVAEFVVPGVVERRVSPGQVFDEGDDGGSEVFCVGVAAEGPVEKPEFELEG